MSEIRVLIAGFVLNDVEVQLSVGQEGPPLAIGVGVEDEAGQEGDDGDGAGGEAVRDGAIVEGYPAYLRQDAHEQGDTCVSI